MKMAAEVSTANAGPAWWDWLGLVLTVVGFIIAGYQLYRVKSATSAANDALSDARRDVMKSQLASLSLHLANVLHDLSFAMETNNSAVAHRALLRFSSIAEEIIPLVRDGESTDMALVEALRQSARDALDVKEHLMSSKSPDVVRNVKKIDTAIATLAKDLTGYMATSRYTSGGATHV